MSLALIFNIGLIAGLLVSLVLLFYPRTTKSGNWLLGISILSLVYAMLTAKLYQSGEIVDFPHISRTGNLPAFLITPAFYLFTRFIFFRERQIQKWDWIILIPFVLYFIDFLPYYLKSAETKAEIIRTGQLENKHFIFAEGWLAPPWFHFYSRQIWAIVYLALSVRILWKHKSVYHSGATSNNKKIFIMVAALACLFAITFLPGFLNVFGKGPWYSVTIQALTITLTLVSITVFLLFNPDYLYGFFWEKELNLGIASKTENCKFDSESGETSKEGREDLELCKMLQNHFETTRPFLAKGYSINELSTEIGVPVYKISKAINSCFESNFNQWVNQYRLVEFETLVNRGLSKQLTLDALSTQCGFSNRATFNAAFKKYKGITPSAYIKMYLAN